MRHVKYYYDHKKGCESYNDSWGSKEKNLFPLFLESMADWKEGSKYYTRRKGKDNYYILYTVSGTGMVEYRDKTVILYPGEMCFIYCMEPHYYATHQCKMWNNIWFHIDGSGVKSYFDLINKEKDFTVLKTEDPLYVKEIFRRLVPYTMKKDMVSKSKISLILMEFLDFLLEIFAQNVNQTEEAAPLWVLHLPAYLDSRRNGELSIVQIAKDMGVTPYQVETMFEKYWETDIISYIRNIRGDQGKEGSFDVNRRNPTWVIEAIRYIDANYDQKINLTSLTRDLRVSQPVFYRSFKQYTGLSPSDYLFRIRLLKAQRLVGDTEEPIVDIAYKCGFSSASFFSKKFYEWMGITPKKYRSKGGSVDI